MRPTIRGTFLFFGALLLGVAACQSGEQDLTPLSTQVEGTGTTLTAPATSVLAPSVAPPTQPATAMLSPVASAESTSPAEPTRAPVAPEFAQEIAGKVWEWRAFQDPAGLADIEAADPALYTLTFEPDGRFIFQADCNHGGGHYTVVGTRLALEFEAMTEASCGPESLDQEYVQYLGEAATFVSEPPDGLILNLTMDGGDLVFASRSGFTFAPEESLTLTAGGVTLDPQDIGRRLDTELVPARPVDSSQPPGPVGHPEHVTIAIDGRVIAWVVPVSDYEQQWEAAGDMTISNALDELQALIEVAPGSGTGPRPPLPILPPQNASNDLAVQFQELDFRSGRGIRFVGRTIQAPLPVANEQLNYYFQGLTGDGRFLVSMIYPVAAAGTPATVEQVPEAARQQAADDYAGYLQEAARLYSELAAEDFTPSLSQLDAMVASIRVEPGQGRGLVDDLVGRAWQWESITDPAVGTAAVEDPSKYMVTFQSDGQIRIQADCSTAGGFYGLEGNSISIVVARASQADCGSGSQADQFLRALGDAAILYFEDGFLTLDLMMDSGSMRFSEVAGELEE